MLRRSQIGTFTKSKMTAKLADLPAGSLDVNTFQTLLQDCLIQSDSLTDKQLFIWLQKQNNILSKLVYPGSPVPIDRSAAVNACISTLLGEFTGNNTAPNSLVEILQRLWRTELLLVESESKNTDAANEQIKKKANFFITMLLNPETKWHKHVDKLYTILKSAPLEDYTFSFITTLLESVNKFSYIDADLSLLKQLLSHNYIVPKELQEDFGKAVGEICANDKLNPNHQQRILALLQRYAASEHYNASSIASLTTYLMQFSEGYPPRVTDDMLTVLHDMLTHAPEKFPQAVNDLEKMLHKWSDKKEDENKKKTMIAALLHGLTGKTGNAAQSKNAHGILRKCVDQDIPDACYRNSC